MGVLDEPVTLVASPSYPNSIVWSKENLIAIASGHLITILNPASPVRPRGMITLPPSNPFPIGVVKQEELFTPCLMPLTLARDTRPCARSISWSPSGFAPNSGCLLAVCTTEGRVKVYRSPFCEYRAEWVEVVDVSNTLYDYLKSINFGEKEDSSGTFNQGKVNAGYVNDDGSTNGLEDSISSKLPEHRKASALSIRTKENKNAEFVEEELTNGEDVDHLIQKRNVENHDATPRKNRKLNRSARAAINPCSSFKQGSSAEKSSRQQTESMEKNGIQLISSQKYAARSALLSSLIVAWSPKLPSSRVDNLNVSSSCSILAVGGKSGNISFWRICEPQCYTIEHGGVPVKPVLIGFLRAHNSWITAISWGIHAASSSESKVVLATGSCDGSVKLWLGDVKELVNYSKNGDAPLTLLREVTTVTYVPVSTISLVVPVASVGKVVLAIGRGSGSLEVWFCHISTNEFQSTSVYNAHNQVVTAIAWASVGRCLYSCSQDNSMRRWVLRGSSLCESPWPLNCPGLKNSIDLSRVLDLCFGLALSPGELMVAVVCSFDSGVLNPMYQSRIQKAAVEFYWTGGQSAEVSSNKDLEDNAGTSSSLCDKDLDCWESTILGALKQFDNGDVPLVLWDILMALLSFRESEPSLVESVLFKWMSSWFVDHASGDSIEKVLFHVTSMLPKITTRRIHLLHIICRRLILGESKLDICHEEMQTSNGLEGEERKKDLWKRLLVNGERELQERFVSFTFKAVLSRASCSSLAPQVGRSWSPVGVAQMQRWAAVNPVPLHDELKLLGSKIGELGSRIHAMCEYMEDEHCCYCRASVPFESCEVARCEGVTHKDGSRESHELKRCAVSMQLGSITSPMWYCACCQRQALRLPPVSFFTTSESPINASYETTSFACGERMIPLCPFCGISLQRLLPDFLLSTSPL